MGYSELAIVALAVILAVFAVKIGVSFDLNQFLRDRKEHRLNRLRALCPHAEGRVFDNKLHIRSLMMSPDGTEKYVCAKCGFVTLGTYLSDANMERFTKDPKLLLDQEKRYGKYAKKYHGV